MRSRRALLALVFGVVAGSLNCVHGGAAAPGEIEPKARTLGAGRPVLEVVARGGDAQGAVAVAVTTEGVAGARGALPGVALAALAEERMRRAGVEASAVGGWDGYRVRVLVPSLESVPGVVAALRAGLLAPVAPGEGALPSVASREAALEARPLADPALADLAQCTGEAFPEGPARSLAPDELERWRRDANGLGRIALAVAGPSALADAVAEAIARTPPWPEASLPRPARPAQADPGTAVYDASGELRPGSARIVLTARTRTAARAVAAADVLANARGPLASRLAALDAPARLEFVSATAHLGGGCLAVGLSLSAGDLAADAPSRIATAAALARQELAVELADVTPDRDLGHRLAMRASDPREAAERAAWWSLSGERADLGATEARLRLVVGLSAPRDPGEPAGGALADALRSEIDLATLAWRARVVETRTRVEQGQGDIWLVLASVCGTLGESALDAGLGAAVAVAAAAQASREAGDAQVEPFVAADALGVLVHGPSHTGELPEAHARRLADLAARAFAADALSKNEVTQATASLLLYANRTDARALDAMASALVPDHPSWVKPAGTALGLASVSDAAIALRVAALRAGPLRVAVVAKLNEAQADAAVRAVDRWIARRPQDARSCPPVASPGPARPGTYSAPRRTGGMSEALLAAPLLPISEGDRTAAVWLAAALDGPEGPLAHALNDDAGAAPPSLVKTVAVTVLGNPIAPAVVVRISALDAALDGAVERAREALAEIGRGNLTERDLQRASAVVERASLSAALDPRARAIALWRGEIPAQAPSFGALRALAARIFRDQALVIVASRPPRPDLKVHPPLREAGPRMPRKP